MARCFLMPVCCRLEAAQTCRCAAILSRPPVAPWCLFSSTSCLVCSREDCTLSWPLNSFLGTHLPLRPALKMDSGSGAGRSCCHSPTVVPPLSPPERSKPGLLPRFAQRK